MTKKRSHTHQYYKTYPNSIGVGKMKGRHQWECALPDCSHFIPGNIGEPVGKISLCNRCMEKMILDSENMKLDKPICDTCLDPDRISIPVDFDFERFEAKAHAASKLGKDISEVTEEEVDRMVQLRRLVQKENL